MPPEFYTPDELRSILLKYQTGFKNSNDPLLIPGSYLIKPHEKLAVVSKLPDDLDDIGDGHAVEIACSVPDCGQNFHCIADYESHYNNAHRYSCAQCKKNLPNAHLLDLHISEVHDSYFAVLAEKKPMFACFLDECPIKSMTSAERKDHCIKLHKFPNNFRFDNPTRKKAKPTTSKVESVNSMETDAIVEEMQRVSLAENSKKLKHIQFGHGTVKSFNSKSNEQSNTQPPKPKSKSSKRGPKTSPSGKSDTVMLE